MDHYAPSLNGAVPAALRGADSTRLLLLDAVLMLGVAAAAILTALGFEHFGGYQPCHLCLMERAPYYAGIPVAALALLAIAMRASRPVLVVLFGLFAALMLYNAGLGVYHSGVEWGLLEGPASCAPSTSVNSAADMMSQLSDHPPSCTVAAGRFFGVSFANANALVSAFLMLAGFWGVRLSWRRA